MANTHMSMSLISIVCLLYNSQVYAVENLHLNRQVNFNGGLPPNFFNNLPPGITFRNIGGGGVAFQNLPFDSSSHNIQEHIHFPGGFNGAMGAGVVNKMPGDDASLNGLISMLESNIQTWSYVESQVMEPHVNLLESELYVPLGHLTTTLVIYGNFNIMRQKYDVAKASLERACPLMELLPNELNHDKSGISLVTGCYDVLTDVYKSLGDNEDVISDNIYMIREPFSNIRAEFLLKKYLLVDNNNNTPAYSQLELNTLLRAHLEEFGDRPEELALIAEQIYFTLPDHSPFIQITEEYIDVIYSYIWNDEVNIAPDKGLDDIGWENLDNSLLNTPSDSIAISMQTNTKEKISTKPSSIPGALHTTVTTRADDTCMAQYDNQPIEYQLQYSKENTYHYHTQNESKTSTKSPYFDTVMYQAMKSNSIQNQNKIKRNILNSNQNSLNQNGNNDQNSSTSTMTSTNQGKNGESNPSTTPAGMHLHHNKQAAAIFDTTTSAGQMQAPRSALTTVQANETAVSVIIFFLVLLIICIVFMIYAQQQHYNQTIGRKKHKRSPKRTFNEYISDLYETFLELSIVIYILTIYNTPNVLVNDLKSMYHIHIMTLLSYINEIVISNIITGIKQIPYYFMLLYSKLVQMIQPKSGDSVSGDHNEINAIKSNDVGMEASKANTTSTKGLSSTVLNAGTSISGVQSRRKSKGTGGSTSGTTSNAIQGASSVATINDHNSTAVVEQISSQSTPANDSSIASEIKEIEVENVNTTNLNTVDKIVEIDVNKPVDNHISDKLNETVSLETVSLETVSNEAESDEAVSDGNTQISNQCENMSVAENNEIAEKSYIISGIPSSVSVVDIDDSVLPVNVNVSMESEADKTTVQHHDSTSQPIEQTTKVIKSIPSVVTKQNKKKNLSNRNSAPQLTSQLTEITPATTTHNRSKSTSSNLHSSSQVNTRPSKSRVVVEKVVETETVSNSKSTSEVIGTLETSTNLIAAAECDVDNISSATSNDTSSHDLSQSNRSTITNEITTSTIDDKPGTATVQNSKLEVEENELLGAFVDRSSNTSIDSNNANSPQTTLAKNSVLQSLPLLLSTSPKLRSNSNAYEFQLFENNTAINPIVDNKGGDTPISLLSQLNESSSIYEVPLSNQSRSNHTMVGDYNIKSSTYTHPYTSYSTTKPRVLNPTDDDIDSYIPNSLSGQPNTHHNMQWLNINNNNEFPINQVSSGSSNSGLWKSNSNSNNSMYPTKISTSSHSGYENTFPTNEIQTSLVHSSFADNHHSQYHQYDSYMTDSVSNRSNASIHSGNQYSNGQSYRGGQAIPSSNTSRTYHSSWNNGGGMQSMNRSHVINASDSGDLWATAHSDDELDPALFPVRNQRMVPKHDALLHSSNLLDVNPIKSLIPTNDSASRNFSLTGPPPGLGHPQFNPSVSGMKTPLSSSIGINSNPSSSLYKLPMNQNIKLKENVTVTITVNCVLLSSNDTLSVKIASPIFGNSKIANALPMRCSLSNPQVWNVTVDVPRSISYLKYKFIAIDIKHNIYVERGPHHVIDVMNINEKEQFDVFEIGMRAIDENMIAV